MPKTKTKDIKEKKPSKSNKSRKNKNKNHKKIKILLIIIALFIATIETSIFFSTKLTKPKNSDTIIVLGCQVNDGKPSSSLKSRIDQTYKLYEEGYAKTIIATGYKSQAECIYNELVKKGVSERNILLDKESKNTYSNLKNADEIMVKHGLDTAIIVTNYYHVYRALSICKELDIEAVASIAPMPDEIDLKIYTNIREIFSILKFYIQKTFIK